MTLVRYEVFRAIVDTGSFSKAALQLKMTQSAVSHAMKSLENEFNIILLTRGPSGVQLTYDGQTLLQEIQQILTQQEQLMQKVSEITGMKTGIIRIGTFPSVSIHWLPRIIHTFTTKFPNITIKFFEGNYDQITSWIADRTIDFGFVSLPVEQSFDIIPLKKDTIRCIVNDKHPLSSQQYISFLDLTETPFIMPKSNIDKDVRHILQKNKITPNIIYEMEEDHAIIAMVQHNLGISILPELTLYRLPDNVMIKDLEKSYERYIGLASLSFTNISPAAKLFVEHIKQWLNENY